MLRLWLGLGNDDPKYLATRHNVGWMALDAIAHHFRTPFQKKKFAYLSETDGIALIKLQGYMNLSGEGLSQFLNYTHQDIAEVLVLYDDIDFSLGTLRLKFNGGDGGHNGMASIIETFGTKEIWRLRIGIRGEMPSYQSKEHKSQFVLKYLLSAFHPNEITQLTEVFQSICPHVQLIAQNPKQAMNIINRPKKEPKKKNLSS